jgi:glycosyltransferase involved in cell wall biosynthesis
LTARWCHGKMKIAMITRDARYGEGTHVRNLVRALSKMDMIEHILLVGPEGVQPLSGKVESQLMKPFGKYFVTRQPHSALAARKIIRELIRVRDFDLIHVHFPILATEFGRPLVSTFHFPSRTGIVRDWSVSTQRPLELIVSNVFHTLYEYFDKRTLQYSDASIFVTSKALEVAMNMYNVEKAKLNFIPNFVDTSLFRPFEPDEKEKLDEKYRLARTVKRILFVGRLDYSKGFHNLVEAITMLKHRGRNVELVIAGEGPQMNRVVGMDNMILLGRVPNQTMPEIYNLVDCFILPSLHENCPISLIEAMSCGLPSIVSDTGEMPHMVRDSRFILEDTSPFSIVNKLEFVLDLDEEERSRISQRNVRIARLEYGMGNVNKILAVYERVLR